MSKVCNKGNQGKQDNNGIGSPFQAWLDRVNARYGGVGSLLVATVLLSLLFMTLVKILSEYL